MKCYLYERSKGQEITIHIFLLHVYKIYLEDDLTTCIPYHRPAEQAEETAPWVIPTHKQNRGPEPGHSRKEIPKYSTRGKKVKGKRGRWKPTISSVSLESSITNTTQKDHQGLSK